MNKKLSKLLIVVLLLNMLLPMLVAAERTDMTLHFNGSVGSVKSKIEKNAGKYYCQMWHLDEYGFTYRAYDGEITVSRYGTELKITFGSDAVLVNGVAQLFPDPVYRTNYMNYISVNLIASVFGSGVTVSETLSKINIDLNERPVLPESKRVSGTIRLPGSDTAPAGGILFKVSVMTVSESVYEPAFAYTTVGANSGSGTYSIDVNDGLDYAEYKVAYELVDPAAFTSYYPTGYYSYYGTQSYYVGHNILIGSDTVADLEVLRNRVLPVAINRNGYAGAVDILVWNSFRYNQWSAIDGSAAAFNIPGDIREVYIYYRLKDEVEGYVPYGYYTPDGTVPVRYSEEDYIDMSNLPDSVSLDILTGMVIKGTIHYDPALRESNDRIDIYAYHRSQSSGYGFRCGSFQKAPGSDTAEFFVTLPVYGDYTYALEFYSYYMGGFLDAAGGFTYDYAAARLFDPGNGNVGDISISVAQPVIYGTVSLPAGKTADEGGIEVEVSVKATNFQPHPLPVETYKLFSVTVMIPEGESSVDYALPYAYDEAFDSVYAACEVINRDNYHTVGQAYDRVRLALPYASKELNFMVAIVDATVEISGVISLPGNMTAQEDMDIEISNGYQSTSVTIKEGESSSPYTLTSYGAADYQISYTLDYPHFVDGYYSGSGTVAGSAEADRVSEATHDLGSINIEILSAPSISGAISLPQGVTAPAGGLKLLLRSGSDAVMVTIPAGGTQAVYTLYLSDAVKGFALSYSVITQSESLWRSGYLTAAGVSARNQQYKFPMENNTAENINFTLLKQLPVTGTIRLPEGEYAQSGIYGNVHAELVFDNGKGTSSYTSQSADTLLIQSGENSGQYTLYIPDDPTFDGYKLRYALAEGSGYYRQAFYAASGTTSAWGNATTLPMTANNVEIVLLHINTVSGTVTRPDGFDAPCAVSVKPELTGNATHQPRWFLLPEYVSVEFEEGDGAKPYSVSIPADAAGVVLRYDVTYGDNSAMLMPYGYYSDDGVVESVDGAKLFPGNVNTTGVNFILKTVRQPSGQEILIRNMLFAGGGAYNVRSSVYDTQRFIVHLNNASAEAVTGTVYVSLYDGDNKLIEVVSADIDMLPWTGDKIPMKFSSAPPATVKRIKIMVWTDDMKPAAKTYDTKYY